MRKMKRIYILGVCGFIVLFLAINSNAAGPGTTGANFLKFGIGARPVGMGEAFTGIADDLNGLYWNPAGLSQISKRQVSFMYNSWFQEISHQYFAYGQRLKDLGAVGVGLTYANFGQMTRTLEDSAGEYAGTGSPFSASDLCLQLTYAEKSMELLDVGITLKLIYEKLDNKSALGFACDIGFLYEIKEIEGLSLGVVLQNAGTALKFMRADAPLPFTIKSGLGYKIFAHKDSSLLVAADLNFPIDNNPNFRLGLEYHLAGFAARIGYKTDTIQEWGIISALAVGVGFQWMDYNFDYAFAPYGELGNAHRISLSAKF